MTVLFREQPASPPTPDLLPLEQGDHLDQATFHARYEAMPEHVRAELIGGVVQMPSPVQTVHGSPSASVVGSLFVYAASTPGVEPYDNTTVILTDDGEPQPDACLVLLPKFGGQTIENEKKYLVGAPELVIEIASSTASIDLHAKKRDYERAGVREYGVLLVREGRLPWFVLRDGSLVEITPAEDGLIRSEVFPGLWFNIAALLRNDRAAVLATLRQGLESPEHAAFVARIEALRTK